MKQVLKIIIMITLLTGASSSISFANDEHHAKKEGALPEGSIYNLKSEWQNENSSKVPLADLVGKPRLIAMVYTKCQTACPLIVRDIREIFKKIPEEKRNEIRVDLFSFDSKNENAKTLSDFKTKYKLDSQWSVYAGSKKSVSEMAAVLGVQYKELPTGEFAHSNVLFFVNKDGEIIAKHEGLGKDPAAFLTAIAKAK